MSAMDAIKEAEAHGVSLSLNGGKLIFKAEAKPSAELLAKLKEHEAGIVTLLRITSAGSCASAATSRPSWWPEPHPRIVKEPPFGSDAVPARYRAAWDVVLAQCPAGIAPFVWEAAMHLKARFNP